MCKLLCYFLLFVYFAESHTNNGLNIDINYNNDSNIENTTNSIKSKSFTLFSINNTSY